MSAIREGMMAIVRNRRAMITRVDHFDAEESGRLHLVEVEYSDGLGADSEQLLWEAELGTVVLEPSALPQVHQRPPMDPREFDAMVRASRWSALTPSLPFSGLGEDRPPLASPLYGAIHPEAYQLVPVLRALEMPRVALMLADAVGLGKTIQAGMILRELMLRRRIRRILVLCPAALRTQWRDEMNEKFALPFEMVDRSQTQKLQRELGVDANPWRTHERIIASYHYLKQPDVLEQFRSIAEPGCDGRLRWDLLIVDEAHHLAPASFGTDSDLAQLLQAIAPWFEHRLFLTATPHNGHTRSFSGLLEALDPIRCTRKSELNEEDRRRVAEVVVRRLKSEINASYEALGQPHRFSRRFVEALPTLHFGAHERALILALRDFKAALFKAMRTANHQDRTAANFSVEVLQKRLLSGPWAFGQSWLALLNGLEQQQEISTAETVARAKATQEEDGDDDIERDSRQRHAERTVGLWLRQWQDKVSTEIAAITAQVTHLGVARVKPGQDSESTRADISIQARKVVADARLRTLEDWIDNQLRSGKDWKDDERLVVFTEYLASLDYLRARLRERYGEGDWMLTLYGGMPDVERDHIKHTFNDPRSSTRILLATDAAGEGLNLQRAARFVLHWDIPWNPARMEQRNGRLDRHGQERDVTVYHFDSSDDASMSFLAKVLRKRSQTREDRVATDEIFSAAILAHFESEEDASHSESRLDQALASAQTEQQEMVDDLPEAPSLPGQSDQDRLQVLKAELDLSPASLQETLETALAVGSVRPRLKSDGNQRQKLVHPIPTAWQELVDHTLRENGPTGPLLAMVFDPAHYIQDRSGRPVFVPEADSRLLHLGDALYHRVMSTFSRYRFDGSGQSASRWTVRHGDTGGADALVLLTIEEMAVNELREPCHHWVRTLVFPVKDAELGAALAHQPASMWSGSTSVGTPNAARDLWDELEDAVKEQVKRLEQQLNLSLRQRLSEAKKAVLAKEQERFTHRRKELEQALKENQLNRLAKEVEVVKRKAAQLSLFSEENQELQRRLSDLNAELALRQTHYQSVLEQLKEDARRTLEDVLPPRYTLHGEARIYPLSVDIRFPEGVA
ncbi:MAG: DISARM system SNF2-like helicase DrmD [Candidatus Cloacimonetes bacterium]|nr:DISARM system SNF2-like helicase DrmD [Candidatus Cloacimonadota bacterium]